MDFFEQSAAQLHNRIAGVVVAPVVDNLDFERTGTVEVEIPWGEPIILSAQVVAQGAGSDRGAFIIPKIGDNVVVAFQDGNPRRPYVLGAIWGGTDKAPIRSSAAADSQYVIRTRGGQEIRIDELADSITIETKQGQVIECNPAGIQARIGEDSDNKATTIILTKNTIEIRARQSIELKAPKVSITAEHTLEFSTKGQATLKGNSSCTLDGSTIRIGS